MNPGESQALEAPNATARPSGFVRDRIIKILVSGWILFHLAGLIVAPASIPPSSELIRNAWRIFGPYLQFMNMNQGNHFFAPDPGVSTSIVFTAELPDGKTVAGKMPSRSTSPRLLYHRHFMLTETLGSLDESDERVRPLLIRALARQICREHAASAVTLVQQVHLLAPPEWCRAGRSLHDPELYLETPLGRFRASDFVDPDAEHALRKKPIRE